MEKSWNIRIYGKFRKFCAKNGIHSCLNEYMKSCEEVKVILLVLTKVSNILKI